MPIENSGSVLIKFPFVVKLLLAVVGALLALVFSGDIDKHGKLNINANVIIKACFGVSVSLTGAPFCIRYMGWHDYQLLEQGFVFLMFAVFGLLMVGIAYRTIEMMKGKSLTEITSEIKSAIKAIIG